LTGALSNLSGGTGGMSSNIGGNMMASAGAMGQSGGMGPGGSNMGSAGPMGGSSNMGASSMSGAQSMGGISGGPSMSDYDRPSMNDMSSRAGPPSGYNSTTAPGGQSGGPSSGYGHGSSSSGYDGRGSMAESAPMSSNRPLDTIIIRNLPLDCNWQVLRQGFSHCGEIKFAEMKERGSGIIQFTNERDAERAISMMHNQKVAGRVIDVRSY